MVGPSADLTTEWEGGSLGELVALLQPSAMPVRIEVIAPGTTSNAGEVHLLAGGLADAFAGSLRRDDAMAALQRLEGARFVVEARLPDPESGSLATPGPREGSLKDRPVAALMRYCEDYVLTCRVEVWRGPDRAAISYRRGEIISTMVGGADGSERLPEVMGWTDGSYEIVLPAPVLPQTSSRKGSARDPMGKIERRRHTTLPMTAGSEAETAGAVQGAPATVRPVTSPPSPARPAPPVPAAPAKSPPSSPATTTARLSPPVQTAPAPAKPSSPTPATPSAGQPPSARPQSAQQPQGRMASPAAASSGAAPATTLRGPSTAQPGPAGAPAAGPGAGKPVPAAPQQAAAPAGQAARPASRPVSPSPADVPAAQPPPGAAPGAKPQGRTPTPAMGSMAVALAPEMTARGTPPVPAVPLIPARPARHTTPPPITPAKAVTAGADPRAGKAEGSTPPVVPVPPAPAPFQLAQPAPARAAKPGSASNDLKPASGTIEAKSRHSNHLPPAPAPIEIADQPSPTPEAEPAQPVNQVMIPARPTTSRRARVARKGLGEHSVKVYVLIGLAIGAGIVVAYWAYWYLPFFHH